MEFLAQPIGLRGAISSRMVTVMCCIVYLVFVMTMCDLCDLIVGDEIDPYLFSLFWFAEVGAAVAGWFWLKARANRKTAPLPKCTVVKGVTHG